MIIAHLSDFHICAPDSLYGGHVPASRLAAAAIAHVNRLDPQPDLVVISGDLADTGTSEEYAVVRSLLSSLIAPCVVLAGNHDDRHAMRAAFADHAYLPREGPLYFSYTGWPLRLIGLDSTVPGHHHGAIDPRQLDWLRDRLAEDPARPTLILLHHHPFRSGIPYLDRYNLANADELASVVAASDSVVAVLCGHVHRAMTTRFAGTIALSCPSTASQIALRLAADAVPASYLEPPGGLLHVLMGDRCVMSHSFPIGDHGPAMDFF